jgi:hypothetical protein
MKKLLKFPVLLLLVLVSELLTGCVASAQTAVVDPYPPRYYAPRYYRPRPARVVVVQPAPVYVRPRPVIVTPAPGYYHRYNARPHRYVRVR